jgi:hypothetical protein
MKKKLTFGVLAATMALSMVTPAFAASNNSTMLSHNTKTVATSTSWDGSYTSTYTIPSYVVSASLSLGSGYIAGYLTSAYGMDAKAAAALGTILMGLITNGLSGDIRVDSTVNYRWVTFPTECYYESTSKIYKSGTYYTTKSYSWTAEVDFNTDVVKN